MSSAKLDDVISRTEVNCPNVTFPVTLPKSHIVLDTALRKRLSKENGSRIGSPEI
jgi:hypothetical protein